MKKIDAYKELHLELQRVTRRMVDLVNEANAGYQDPMTLEFIYSEIEMLNLSMNTMKAEVDWLWDTAGQLPN